MEAEITKTLTLTVNGEDIEKLRTAVKKVCSELIKPGLKNNTFTGDDVEILKDLRDRIK